MSAPPPEAYEVARAALCTAYDRKHDGITYGGLDAEAELQGRMSAHIAGLDSHAPTELVAAAEELSPEASWRTETLACNLVT